MARRYAGILALLGLIVVLTRAMKNGAGFESTILQAIAMSALFAVIGAFIGITAQITIEESTRRRVQAELDTLADLDTKQQTS